MLLKSACALVPFRSINNAKGRLSPLLTETERGNLALAMLHDTLMTLSQSPISENSFILTDDEQATELGQQLGYKIIKESQPGQGLNGAVQQAVQHLAKHYKEVLIVHADLPLLSVNEVNLLLKGFAKLKGPRRMLIVPDVAKLGSNCLMIDAAMPFNFQYGDNSFNKHLAFVKGNQIRSMALELEGAARDIDTPKDLDALLKQLQVLPKGSIVGRHSADVLKQLKVADKLITACITADSGEIKATAEKIQ